MNCETKEGKIFDPDQHKCVLLSSKRGKEIQNECKKKTEQKHKELKEQKQKLQLQIADVKVVKGPVRFIKLSSDTYNKRVLLIGDHHNKKEKCKDSTTDSMELPEYLEGIVRSTFPNMVDMFLETEYRKKEIKRVARDTWIGEVEHHFASCLKPSRTGRCKLNNLRVHYADVRIGFDINYTEIIAPVNTLIERFEKITGEYAEALFTILLQTIDQLKIYEFDKAIQLNKVQKQLDAVEDEELREQIYEFGKAAYNTYTVAKLTSLISQAREEVQKLHEEAAEKKDPKEEYSINPQSFISLFILNQAMLQQGMVFMDMYIMARMFRPFVAENVIIYAGDNHITNYLRFLTKQLDFTLENSSTSKEEGRDFQCLNVEGFYPYF